MGFAEAVDCPVILIADIDKGGVFAHLVGTLALLSESEQARVKGFVINRFRGDISLLQSGLDWLELTPASRYWAYCPTSMPCIWTPKMHWCSPLLSLRLLPSSRQQLNQHELNLKQLKLGRDCESASWCTPGSATIPTLTRCGCIRISSFII